MDAREEALLRIKPWICGVRTSRRAVTRLAESPSYLALSTAELAELENLSREPVTVSRFLARHLGGSAGSLNFRQAVSLVIRLIGAGYIQDSSSSISAKFAAVSEKAIATVSRGLNRVGESVSLLLDAELVAFADARVHPAFRRVGAWLVSFPFAVAVASLLVGMLVYSGITSALEPALPRIVLDDPEGLILKTFLSFSLALSWLGLVQMAALAGTGARFVGGGIRLTCLCILRLTVDDRDAMMLPRPVMLRYHALALMAPWLSAVLMWELAKLSSEFMSFATLFASTFVLIGVLMLCPLARTPLVRIAEGSLATLDFLELGKANLVRGLFRFGADRGGGEDSALQTWMAVHASLSFLWLYGFGLAFADAVISSAETLWPMVAAGSWPPRSVRPVAAAFILAVLLIAMLVPLLRLVMIPFQNVYATLDIPLRKARQGIKAFAASAVQPGEALAAFLREIPVFADVPDAMLRQLIPTLQYRRYRPGQILIRQGEAGSEFFILAEGRARVVIEHPARAPELLDVLTAGDTFGEIALLERGPRTATIEAQTECRTLVLGRGAFDRLFPESSELRTRLTRFIRQVKLLLESQALSHLSPRQIRSLLRHTETVTFGDGDFLIREGAVGEEAFLIESGEVQVVNHQAAQEIAVLGRGALVGAIALIRDVRRTASVRARGPVQALRISKSTFLEMCMSNVFVAMLVADLSEKQLAGREAG